MSRTDIDWEAMFTPDVPLLETVVRGSVIYLAVFVLMRLCLRRTAGELTMLDFLFVLLAASAGAGAMTGGSTSIVNSLVLVTTIVAWNYSLNSLSFFLPAVERLTAPAPLPVIRDGRMLPRNMRREFLTAGELHMQLREQGIEEIEVVKVAYIEGDGHLSVIRRDEAPVSTSTPK